MLPPGTVPVCLLQVLQTCRGVFTGPSFVTFTLLVTGALSGIGPRTVAGMWSAAGMARRVHWSGAHRFFSCARWDLDALGLALTRLAVGLFVGEGRPLTVAVDDTLFHRYGKKVFGVAWQHDGSAKGRDGLGRGNCFVVAGLVVTVPFATRSVCRACQMVLFRLHRPKQTPSKPEQARELAEVIAAAFPGRRVHVVADNAYKSPAWRGLPARVTFTTRLASNAVLYAPAPPRTGRRGRPALKGSKLGTPATLAATATWRRARVHRYGQDDTVDLAVVNCLWHGSLGYTPVRVVLLRNRNSRKGYNLALVTTDLTATPQQVITRYADRWSIEQSFKDSKDHLGVGDAQNRLPTAVERTVPFGLLTLTILICWYHHTGHAADDITARRTAAPWYRHKQTIAVTDMLIAFRRTRIAAITAGQTTPHLNDQGLPTCTVSAA